MRTGLGVATWLALAPRVGWAQASFEAMIAEVAALDVVPGLAVAVVREDSTIYRGCFGFVDPEHERPVTPSTVFYPVDLSSALLGQTAAVLHERGSLDLDRPLLEYLPELALPQVADPASIALRDVVAGSHGLLAPPGLQYRVQTGDVNRESLLALLEKCRADTLARNRQRAPYVGSVLTTLALEGALGRPAVDVVRETILAPCGLRSTTFDPRSIDSSVRAQAHGSVMHALDWLRLPAFPFDPPCSAAILAATPVATTLDDLARWLEVTMNGGRLDGETVLSESALRATLTVHESIEPEKRRNHWPIGKGLGWTHRVLAGQVRAAPSRGGGVSFLPEHRVGVVVLVNADEFGAPGRITRITELISIIVFATLVGERDVSEAFEGAMRQLREIVEDDRALASSFDGANTRRELALSLEAYAGIFGNDAFGELRFSVRDHSLFASLGCVDAPARVVDGDAHAVIVPGVGYCKFDLRDGFVTSVTCGGRRFERLDQ